MTTYLKHLAIIEVANFHIAMVESAKNDLAKEQTALAIKLCFIIYFHQMNYLVPLNAEVVDMLEVIEQTKQAIREDEREAKEQEALLGLLDGQTQLYV